MRPVHGWRRALRWLQAFFAIVLSLVLLVIIAATLVLHTSWGRHVARSQIQARLDATFVGGATLGDVRGNPLSELELHDLVINGPDGKPAIAIKTLRVKLALMPLISHQLRVDRVIADDVDILMKRQATGDYELAHLTKPGPKSTWNIALPDVRVHRGHVKIDTGKERVDLDGLELYLSSQLPFDGPIDASVSLGTTWRQRGAPISLAAVVHVGKDAVDIRSALVSVGGVAIAAAGARIPKGEAPKAFGGTVAVRAPAGAVRKLAPGVKVPADVAIAIEAMPEGTFTDLAIAGSVGGSPVRGFARGDVGARSGHGFVTAVGLDLGRLSSGKVQGDGGAFVAFDVAPGPEGELPVAKAMVQTWGNFPDAPKANAVIALDTRGTKVHAELGAVTGTGVRAGAGAEVTKDGTTLVLDRATLVAATNDPAAASHGKAQLHGAIDARISAHGALAPHADLAIAGHINGDRLRFQDMSARTLRVNIDARHLPARPIGTARIALTNIQRQSIQLRDLIVAAGNRPDGKLQVSVRTDPKPAPWRVDLDALVTPGETIGIELQRHVVRAAGGAQWRGTSGHVTISPERIEVRNVKSASADGHLAVDATFGRKTGDLAAQVDAAMNLQAVSSYHGTADARIQVDRARGKLAADVTANLHGLRLDPRSAMTLDGTAKITAKDGKLVADISADSLRGGSAEISVDVDGPRDMASAAQWKKLRRAAVTEARIQLSDLNLKVLGTIFGGAQKQIEGTVNGDVRMTPDTIGGEIQLRGLRGSARDLGVIDGDLRFDQTAADEVTTTAEARIGTIGRLDAVAKLGMPARLFDPAAWKKLGLNVIHGATVRSSEIPFEPGTLERFGIVSQYRGVASISADVEPGLTSAALSFNLHDFRGGVIVAPITTHIDAILDGQSIRATGAVRSSGVTILTLASKIPVTVQQMRADPSALKNAPLYTTIAIPSVPAKALLAVLGNTQITTGDLDGKIELGGTVARPTAKADIVARNVAVPNEGIRRVQAVRELRIAATWDGQAGKVIVDGNQTAGGMLRLEASADKDHLDQARASLVARALDLAPIVPFLPGPAGGLGGRLDASFSLVGTDPRTAQLGGTLALTEGRIPIAPAVGTLFHGDLRVAVRDNKLDVKLAGKLGRGDVMLTANAPLEGFTPNSGTAKLTVKKVQLIGTTEPIIDATVDANIARVDDKWTANLSVEGGSVQVPDTKGEALDPVGAPPDLVFKGNGKHVEPPAQVDGNAGQPHRKVPERPMFVANVKVRRTHVESKEVRGYVNGKLTVAMDDHEIGVVGNVWLGQGNLDLFDRRYIIDRAALHFDGSTDPMLDVRIVHDFPEVTTVTEVHGRMSKPELLMSSTPATYSQAELLGFLLGGEPGGDPSQAPSAREKVTGAGTSLIANQISGYVKKALPVDIDVLRYESASASSSAAVLVGTWITQTLFLAYRHRIEARPDENTGEGEVEYWIRRRLVLEGTIGDRGYNGLDLLWRRRW
jgi:autotransporter translocation and assembly factor TamB